MSVGIINGVSNTPLELLGATRIGCKLTAGVFSVLGANGVVLTDQNPGYVTIPDRTNPMLLNTYRLTANQSFQDSAGTSTIINNLFGTDTGVAWSSDIPFYLYAAINDAQDAPVFGISRVPNMDVVPAVGDIGTPASATANNQYSLFIFNSVTRANYDGNPVVCLGSFRMRKNGSDDWTVQSFSANGDGIGKFQEGVQFTMPSGVRGAGAGCYFSNSGTPPIFNSQSYTYWLNRDGMCFLNLEFSNVSPAGTPGVGTDDLHGIIPLDSIANFTNPGAGNYQDKSASLKFNQVFPSVNAVFNAMLFYKNDASANILLRNDDFNLATTQSIRYNVIYPIKRG